MEQFNTCESKHMDIAGFAAAVGSATLELGGAQAVGYAQRRLAQREGSRGPVFEDSDGPKTGLKGNVVTNQIDGMNIYD